MGASNFQKDDQGEKILNYIRCHFSTNILLFFGSINIGKPNLVYIIILLTKMPQMEKKAEYVGNTFHKSLLEDNGRLLAFHQLIAAVLQNLHGFWV